MDTRRIEKNHLGIGTGQDAKQAVAGRLRLWGNNGDFLAQQLVDQRRFAHVRPPDHGNKTRPVIGRQSRQEAAVHYPKS